ncbi:hypothetical protein [Novosphingobium huizhouense]|uniref:hypothetical protein n=1 Tax=Novosphingobium huizhouense TaxID=2866625 RepID=UPI001CD846F7|nr:hypothetical protein [Novosphingobium huizhouense]
MTLPDWPPRDWRKLLALIFSIAGAVVLTAIVWWGMAALLPDHGWTVATEDNRATTLRWVLWIAIGGVVLVLCGLGMAINRRTLRAQWGDKGASFDGGDSDSEEAQH